MLNKAQIIGNLGSDGDLRYTQDNTPVMNLRICSNEFYRDKDGQKVQKAEWHRVSIFGKVAESLKDFLVKGRQVFVEGKLETRHWTGDDSVERYSTSIVVRPGRGLVQLLGGPRREKSEE